MTDWRRFRPAPVDYVRVPVAGLAYVLLCLAASVLTPFTAGHVLVSIDGAPAVPAIGLQFEGRIVSVTPEEERAVVRLDDGRTARFEHASAIVQLFTAFGRHLRLSYADDDAVVAEALP